MARRRQPELHHRDQAVPAAERPRLLAERGEQRHCFVQGLWTMIFEGSRYHGILPGARHRTGAICRSSLVKKRPFGMIIDRNRNPDQHHGARTPPLLGRAAPRLRRWGRGGYAQGGHTTCPVAAAIPSRPPAAPCPAVQLEPNRATAA